MSLPRNETQWPHIKRVKRINDGYLRRQQNAWYDALGRRWYVGRRELELEEIRRFLWSHRNHDWEFTSTDLGKLMGAPYPYYTHAYPRMNVLLKLGCVDYRPETRRQFQKGPLPKAWFWRPSEWDRPGLMVPMKLAHTEWIYEDSHPPFPRLPKRSLRVERRKPRELRDPVRVALGAKGLAKRRENEARAALADGPRTSTLE